MTKPTNIPQNENKTEFAITPKSRKFSSGISFDDLSEIVRKTHQLAQANAVKAINKSATLRNWLIGCYIVEFEQKGADRAVYGEKLLQQLEEKVATKGLNVTLFKNSRSFYLLYPQVIKVFEKGISPTLSDKFEILENNLFTEISELPKIAETSKTKISPTLSDEFITPADKLIENLSFSHICEIITVDDPLARCFYETECLKCGWSVRELRRQISTNLFVRTGISEKPEKLIEQLKTLENPIQNEIKQPFTFEFLGLSAQDVVTERGLEQLLIEHLQYFLLELGKGFCFEARQKRIIIDDEYYFADLVFYHRILHCNVIVELKNDEFKHEYLGQLNAYVSYYKENEMNEGDNPPVGILLCTRKGKKMVEYAIAGMDNHLFVSTYLLQLPDKDTLKQFLITQMEEENQ